VACGFVEGMDFDQRDDRRYRSVLESAGLSARSKAEMLAFVLDNAAEEDADED